MENITSNKENNAKKQQRAERLAKQLRQNLLKRKEQARKRKLCEQNKT